MSLTRRPCLVRINNPEFRSGMQIISWRIDILNWADHDTFHAQIMILVLDAHHYASNFCHTIFHRLSVCKLEVEFLFNELQSVALLNSRWHIVVSAYVSSSFHDQWVVGLGQWFGSESLCDLNFKSWMIDSESSESWFNQHHETGKQLVVTLQKLLLLT